MMNGRCGGTASDKDCYGVMVRTSGDIAVVSINRQPKRNALTLALWQRLAEVFGELGSDQAVRAIMLTGSGGSFCAGADISEFDRVRSTPEQVVAYEAVVDSCSNAIAATAQPTIAVLHGPCLGGGCSIALACDFRYAHPDAFLGIPAARLSIIYGESALRRLTAVAGVSTAKRMLYSAGRLGANEALLAGLIDRVSEDPMADARAFCDAIARNAPLTITAAKVLLNAVATGTSIPEGTMDELLGRALRSQDYREGRAAFLEKRQPLFKGA
jgi:enoyl-CoA hydratase/carnithine racemase